MAKNLQVKDIPEALHEKLQRFAHEDGRSIRDFVLEAVRREVARREFRDRLSKRTPVNLGRPASHSLDEARRERERERFLTWVIDASVAVEILLRTDLGQQAWNMVQDTRCLAPDLLDAEVLSVVRRECFSGRISESRAKEALSDLVAWDLERIPAAPLLLTAWTFRGNVSGYDALYVAAAVRRKAGLLTADGRLARSPITGLTIHHLRE